MKFVFLCKIEQLNVIEDICYVIWDLFLNKTCIKRKIMLAIQIQSFKLKVMRMISNATKVSQKAITIKEKRRKLTKIY